MKKVLSMFVVLLMSTMMWGATSSAPENAPDVMLQAFYWDSYPNGSGSAYGNTGWSTLLNQVDELGEYFDLVWLPPVAGGAGTGYHPKQYSNLSSAWGSESQLRELITKLKAKGTRTVADIVINHIEGSTSWCSFATMDFGTYGKFYPEASWICKTDEMNKNDNAGSCKGLATGADDDGYGDEANYSEARDWDHKSSNVQAMFRAYLKWLKNDVGFDGWRYDYGKGFHHSHINDYNSAAGAYMAVVEYWDGNSGVIRSRLEDANWNEMAFDFGTKYDALNNGICSFDYSKCKGAGLLGAGLSKHAVTFVDNHDTFTRNDSEFGGQNNSMSSNLKDRLLQANAFILSMPGIPCVFYPHWVTYKSEIKAMIEARHLVGVHSQSEVKDESAEQGGYQATIVGKNGWLILQLGNKVGGSFDGFSKKASGNGYAIWVKTNTVSEFYLTGNAALVGDKAWKADAIKVTGNTYTFSNLAAGKDYQLKVTVDGTWNTAKGFSDLTTTADGLSGDNDGNICFSLSEAGDVKVTYTGAVFKLEGKFATSGSGSGEEQTTTKFYITGNDLLVGESKAWNPAAIASTEDSYTIENLTTGKDYKMKITTDGTWNTAKGFSNLTTTADGLSGDNDGNICFSLSEAGSVKVTYTSSVFKVEGKFVTAGSGSGDEPVDSVTVYFVNTLSWAKVNAFVWPASGNPLKAWPGEAAKKEADKVNGNEVYSYKFPKTYVNIIFNNGSTQTVDLTWAESKPYFYPTGTESSKVKGTWYAKADVPSAGGGSGDDPQPVDSVTVYFLNTIKWAKVNAFVWPASGDPLKAWPGEAMKKEADKLQGFDVYSYKFPKTYVNIIFNDGTKQTVDLTWAESKPYFYPTETNSEGKYKGEWYAKADVPAAVVPAKFYITGDSALVVDAGLEKAKAWNADAIKSEVDTFELSLKSDQYYVLKVTLDGTWEGENNVKGYNELTEKTEGLDDVGNDHNIGFKLSEAGKVQVIYTIKDNKTIFKLAGKFVTEGSGSGDDPQPGAAKFYVTGDTALVVAAGADKMKAWKADAIKSEKDTLELSLPKGLYHLKVVVDGNWEGGKVKGFTALTEPVTAGLSADADDNIVFTLDEAGKVQVIYFVKDSKETFKIDGKFHVETPAKFYITGDSALVVDAGLEKAKAWNADAIKSEVDTFELSLKADQYYVLKVTLDGTWEGENNVKGYNELTEKAEGLVDDSDDHNIGFKLSEAGKVQVIYTTDKDNKTIFKLAGKFVTEGSGSGDDPQPTTAKFYITGDSALVVDAGLDKAKAWNADAIKSEVDTFELSLKADQYYVLKVTLNGTWEGENNVKGYNELTEKADGLVDDGSDHNIGFKLSEAGKVQVIYTTDKDNKTIFKLAGKFVTEGSGSGDDPQPTTAKFYVTGDTALVVAAGADKMKAWKADAIKSEKDTLELSLPKGLYHLKVVVDGNWEGGKVKGFTALTEPVTAGLSADADDNIVFTLDEAGKVQVIYFVKDSKETFKIDGKFHVETPAKFYITGDSALVVDAGLEKAKAWNADAIKSEVDTFELSLKADQYYVLKVTLDGTWEGENNVKGYNELTEKADGLVDDGSDHNIGFKLSEAGKVQVIYTVMDNKTIFKLAGKFVTEGSGSGDDPQPGAAKFYITGDSALVVDAGLDKAKAWNADAIKSEVDTFELSLKADQYYVLKVTLNGTWEGENNVKGYNELTEKADGLVDDGSDHNIGFKLSEAGKVQVIYTIKDNKTIFKLAGKFVTEGSGSGDDPQPGTKYFMKNNWNGGAEWSWKEMTAAENNTFKLEKVVFGGTGVNYNTAESDEGAEWVAVDAFAGDEIGALDTVTFVLDLAAEKKVKAILLGKYQEGQGGGDDPQPGTKYFMKNNWNGGEDWTWKEMAAAEDNTFKLEKVVFGGAGVNYNTAESDEGAEWVEVAAFDGDEVGALDTVTFVLDLAAEKKVKAILLGKYNEGQGGGDDPQPGTKYFMKNNWNGGAEWSWKEMTAAENNTFKLEKVVFGGTGVNYNTAESDEGAEWVAVDAFAGDEIGALDTVTFVLDLAAEKKVKAILLGKYNEGSGSGDDPQPGTKYFMKNNWNGGEWSWKEMTAAENNTFKLEKVVFGGTGVNYNTAESDEGAEWVAVDAFAGDEIGALDTVTFVLDLAAEKKVKAILLGKYNEGQGGGDNPQPGTKYFMKNNWNGGAEWSWKEMTAAENNTFKLEKVVFGGTGVNYNTAESDEGAEWVAVDAFAGDEIGALDTVTFVLDLAAEKKVKAILLGKYSEGQGGGDDPQPGENVTVYFVNNVNWEAVNAYVWVGEGDAYKQWPGEALTKETAQAGVAKREAEQHQGYEIYSYTFPSKYVNIIFNNGSVQTVDLTWNAAKPYFYPDGTEGTKIKGTWYAKEEIPSGGEPIVTPEDGYYLLGTFNSWTPAAEYLFKANPDKANEYFLSVTLAVDDKLKVAKVEDGAAKTWYPDGMGNDYVVDAAHAGAKVIYFQTTYNAEWEAFGGYFYIASDTGTGLDNSQAGATYQKFIENGQLFILRDGRIYTPAGQFVR